MMGGGTQLLSAAMETTRQRRRKKNTFSLHQRQQIVTEIFPTISHVSFDAEGTVLVIQLLSCS